MSLIDDSDRHAIYLQKLASHLLNTNVYPSMADAYRAARLILLNQESIKSVTALRRVQAEISRESGAILARGMDALTKDLLEAAAYEAEFSAKLTGSYVGQKLAVPPPKQIQSFIDKSIMTLNSGQRITSGTWAQYVARANEAVISQYNSLVASGYQQGLTVGQIAREIKNSTDGVLAQQANTLARTGLSHYATQAREAMALENSDIVKVRVFTATFDNRTTLQCFPAETEVSAFGFIENVFRSKYVGEAITIRTASGKELTGTPNHPILTSAGFLPLGEIDPSKHVVYAPLVDNVPFPCAQDVGVKSMIGEIFDSLNEPSVSRVSSKGASTADFYGDGFGGDDKVDIVTPYRKLRYNVKTIFDQDFGDKAFGWVRNIPALLGLCLFLKHFFCWRPIAKAAKIAPGSFKVGVKEPLGSSGFCNYFRWAASCIKHFNSFFSVKYDSSISNSPWEAFHDPVALEKGGDGGGGCVVLLSNFTSGKPIPVLADNIVSVSRKFIDTHVYTLQSDNGIYMAGGLIVKNCRGNHGKAWDITDQSYPKIPQHFGCRSTWIFAESVEEALTGRRSAVGGKASGKEAYQQRKDRLENLRERRSEQRADGIDPPATATKVKYKGSKDADIFNPGQINAATSQDSWMKSQPAWFQDSALGPTRAKLLREGGMQINQFVDMLGKPIPLRQLRELDAAAFAQAGL